MEQIKDYTLKNKKGFILSDDQNEIVDALVNNDFFFNCAQTGFGKTLTTITAAVHKAVARKDDDIHFILLLPGSAVKAFSDTLGGILGIPFNIYTAEKIKTQVGARFHIFNYSTIGRGILKSKNSKQTEKKTKETEKRNKFFEQLAVLKKEHPNLWLIADEAHVLQDPNTIQYQLVSTIKPWFIGIWFLTATPILNNLEGFYYMVSLVDPKFSPNIYAFKNKYMIFKESGFYITKYGQKIFKKTFELVGYKNLDILQDRFSKISIIKSKEYDIDFIYRSTKMSDQSFQYYKYAADGIFRSTKDKNGKIKKSKQNHAGARLHDLQMVVSNSHPQFKMTQSPNVVTDKEVLLINTIREVLERNEATLIYFSYLETLERVKYILNALKSKLGITNIFEISGSVSTTQRKAVETKIGPRSVTLITSAGTESVNLQRANNLIFYEIPFPLRQFIQACGRITRMDSNYDKFQVYILEAEGTIDTYKKNRIVANSTPIKSVLGKSNILPTVLLEFSLEDIQLMKDELLWLK